MYEQAQQAGQAARRQPVRRPVDMRTGGGGGFRTMTEEEVSDMFGGDDSPFSDFFQTFFGGAASRPRPRGADAAARAAHARRAATSSTRSSSNLEDALHGTVQRLGIQHDGQQRNVEVRIPAGVTDGSRVRVAGEGGRGSGERPERRSVPAGPSCGRMPRFERKGRDLYTQGARAGHHRGARRRSRRADARRQVAAAQDSADDAERPGVPPARPRPADDRQDRTSRGDLYATVDVAVAARRSIDRRSATHYEALARAGEGAVDVTS